MENPKIQYKDTKIVDPETSETFIVNSETGEILATSCKDENYVSFDAKSYREKYQVPRLPEHLNIYDIEYFNQEGEKMIRIRSIDTKGD